MKRLTIRQISLLLSVYAAKIPSFGHISDQNDFDVLERGKLIKEKLLHYNLTNKGRKLIIQILYAAKYE